MKLLSLFQNLPARLAGRIPPGVPRRAAGAALLATTALGLGVMAWRLAACGPFAVVARFDDLGRPDVPLDRFLQGELGIVRPGWPLMERVVAYRTLAGLELDPEARESLRADGPEGFPASEVEVWQQARAAVMGPGEAPRIDPETSRPDYSSYLRIHPAAFRLAATTLGARVKAHGAADPTIRAWIQAQDQVFASTKEAPAIPSAVKEPAWLKADRDYQRASALFYAERFEEARRAFEALSQDPASPWRSWGAYLQARAWVREASLRFEDPKAEGAQALYRAAQGHLEAMLKTRDRAEAHEAARRYLDLVRHRTEPQRLQIEACRELLKARPGSDFRARLEAYRTASLAAGDVPFPQETEADRKAEDLHAWLRVMGPRAPKEEAAEEAVARWKAQRTLPWLVAALSLAAPDHPERPALRAAAKVEPASQASRRTLWWARLQMELPELKPAQRRIHLEAALKEKDLPPWAENRLRAQRRLLATSLEDWTAWAASRLSGTEIVSIAPPEVPGPEDPVVKRHGVRPLLLDDPEAAVLNDCLPLEALAAQVTAGKLGLALTAELAQAVWIRAVLLERWTDAESVQPALEARLRERIAKEIVAQDPLERRFEAVRLMMEFPGLRPVLTPGLGRGDGGVPALQEFDPLRDNWWCRPHHAAAPEPPLGPAFLPPALTGAARKEQEALARHADAWIHFGETILAYAQARSEDPRVPPALHRFIRLTRTPACPSPDVSTLSRKAFRFLHQKYPGSEWSKKTPYYY